MDKEIGKTKKFFLELKDLTVGAVFPFMMSCILSTSIIAFGTSGDDVVNAVVIVFGELFVLASLLVFGRQNGVVAYRKTVSGEKKRALDERYVGTGEYALYKGFLIGFISCVPFLLFSVIYAIYPFLFVEFLLKYAFGWAVVPFGYIEGAPAALSMVAAVVPVAVLGAAYVWGKKTEERRQAVIAKAEEIKGKKHKK